MATVQWDPSRPTKYTQGFGRQHDDKQPHVAPVQRTHTQHECGMMTRPRRMTLSLFPPRMTGGPTNISLASTRIHLFPARCSVWLSHTPSRRMDAILSQSYRTREAPAKVSPNVAPCRVPSRSEYLYTSTRDLNGGISSVTIGGIDCSPSGSMFALFFT